MFVFHTFSIARFCKKSNRFAKEKMERRGISLLFIAERRIM